MPAIRSARTSADALASGKGLAVAATRAVRRRFQRKPRVRSARGFALGFRLEACVRLQGASTSRSHAGSSADGRRTGRALLQESGRSARLRDAVRPAFFMFRCQFPAAAFATRLRAKQLQERINIEEVHVAVLVAVGGEPAALRIAGKSRHYPLRSLLTGEVSLTEEVRCVSLSRNRVRLVPARCTAGTEAASAARGR